MMRKSENPNLAHGYQNLGSYLMQHAFIDEHADVININHQV